MDTFLRCCVFFRGLPGSGWVRFDPMLATLSKEVENVVAGAGGATRVATGAGGTTYGVGPLGGKEIPKGTVDAKGGTTKGAGPIEGRGTAGGAGSTPASANLPAASLST